MPGRAPIVRKAVHWFGLELGPVDVHGSPGGLDGGFRNPWSRPSWRALTMLSYPVYVYLDAAQTGLGGLWLLALRFACTIALATASYYLVERPVMYGTFWRSLKAITPSVALTAVTVAVIIVGTLVPATAAVRVRNGLSGTERRSLNQAGAFKDHPVKFMLVGDSIAGTLAVAFLSLILLEEKPLEATHPGARR